MRTAAAATRRGLHGSASACGMCVLWLAFCTVPCRAGGDVYAHVDPISGLVVLNNMPPPAARATPTAPDGVLGSAKATVTAFARVSPVRQREIDADRRTILQYELNEERRILAAASAVRATNDVLARHAANIAALQRELARLTEKKVD